MGITERREREREQRHNAIIAAAEIIFFRKGFDKATMQEVAREAELSKGTLYLYFKDKESLHFAIMQKGLKILSKMMQDACEEKYTGAENALEIGKAYIRFYREHHDYFRAIMAFESEKLQKIDVDLHGEIFKPESPLMVLVQVVEQGMSDGTVRKDMPAAELAVLLWSQLTGIMQFIDNRKVLMQSIPLEREKMLMDHFRILQDGIIRNIKVVE